MNKLILITLIVFCLSEPTGRTHYSDLSCLVHNPRKRDCGWIGINQQGCEERDCCWKEDADPSIPWCFYGEDDSPTFRTINNLSCLVSREERVECGYLGINKEECEAKGCCWVTDDIGSIIPWCFKGVNDSDQKN
mgnify:CR=1 FL=1